MKELEDLQNNMMMSSLSFLFTSYIPNEKEKKGNNKRLKTIMEENFPIWGKKPYKPTSLRS